MSDNLVTKLLDVVADSLDIPKTYYVKAVDRHKSLGEWLCRRESKLAVFNPSVHPQGSFRYGTVVRPLFANAEYDLDNVTTLEIAKTVLSQKDLKQLYGAEVRGLCRLLKTRLRRLRLVSCMKAPAVQLGVSGIDLGFVVS